MDTEKQIILSKTDKIILESYKTLVEGLASYLGSGYEMVLHSLGNVNESVIKIVNGYHTGRKEGAPITDLALAVLDRIQTDKTAPGYITYATKSKKGEPVKAATIRIPGENGRTIGLLCINYYLSTPYFEVLNSFIPKAAEHAGFLPENFVEDTDELIRASVANAKVTVAADKSILPSLANKEIVAILSAQGIFKLKDAVLKVAALLDISKNTVYLHLRSLHKNEVE